MSLPEWAREVSADDLPENARELAECIGIEAALTLMEHYGGAMLYIPKLDTALRNARNRRITSEYTGTNARQLALKYGVTESWIRRLACGDQLEGQLSIFDEPL